MKKPWKVLVLVVCVVFVLSLALAGCGGEEGDDAIVGTWSDQEGFIEYEFQADGVLAIRAMGQEEETSYSVNDGKLSLPDLETGERLEFEYKIDGDELTISAEGEEETLIRKE